MLMNGGVLIADVFRIKGFPILKNSINSMSFNLCYFKDYFLNYFSLDGLPSVVMGTLLSLRLPGSSSSYSGWSS